MPWKPACDLLTGRATLLRVICHVDSRAYDMVISEGDRQIRTEVCTPSRLIDSVLSRLAQDVVYMP